MPNFAKSSDSVLSHLVVQQTTNMNELNVETAVIKNLTVENFNDGSVSAASDGTLQIHALNLANNARLNDGVLNNAVINGATIAGSTINMNSGSINTSIIRETNTKTKFATNIKSEDGKYTNLVLLVELKKAKLFQNVNPDDVSMNDIEFIASADINGFSSQYRDLNVMGHMHELIYHPDNVGDPVSILVFTYLSNIRKILLQKIPVNTGNYALGQSSAPVSWILQSLDSF